jgi:hypothetical protein
MNDSPDGVALPDGITADLYPLMSQCVQVT